MSAEEIKPWRNSIEFAEFLASKNIIDEAAVFDEQGYDGGATMERVARAFESIPSRTNISMDTAQKLADELLKCQTALDSLYQHNAAVRQAVIHHYGTRHNKEILAPVQSDLDAKDKRIIELMETGVAKDFELLHKDKLLREAREIILRIGVTTACCCSGDLASLCLHCSKKTWLARVKG